MFRNASHAYNILGRDKRRRAEYDATLLSRDYKSAWGEFTNDFVQPFARGVVIPLLNYTLRSIEYVAIPLARMAINQTQQFLKRKLSSSDDLSMAMSNMTLDSIFNSTKPEPGNLMSNSTRRLR